MGSACNSCNKSQLSVKSTPLPSPSTSNFTSTWMCSPLTKTLRRENLTQRHGTIFPPLKSNNSRKTFHMDQEKDSKDYISVMKSANFGVRKDQGLLLEFRRPSISSTNGLQGLSYQDNSSSLPHTFSTKKQSHYQFRPNFHKYHTSIADNKASEEQKYSRGYTTYQRSKFLENRSEARYSERSATQCGKLDSGLLGKKSVKVVGVKNPLNPIGISTGVVAISYPPKSVTKANKEGGYTERADLSISQRSNQKNQVAEGGGHHVIRRAARSCMVDSVYRAPVHKNVLKKITIRSRKDSCSSRRK
eukprot:TRINITY_DN3610_c0_g1_i2.p1 TRINITY_DN3610_c0_g1~~TRINITY_DN3610_c0_g1_i2.p1  ORF type:complete len:303 (+),score=68.38 TRINITY_DN3610_c0_g1_i2:107-1015(+)